MAFHVSIFGVVNARLQAYTDRDGFVPEVGDRWQDFRWQQTIARTLADPDTSACFWEQFLQRAEERSQQAIDALDALRWDKPRRHHTPGRINRQALCPLNRSTVFSRPLGLCSNRS